jgi:proteasome lid subunit RPN8/RPN11
MRIPQALYDEIVAHALEEKPNECCGMVATLDGTARHVHRATNIHASPLRYEIEPGEMYRLLSEIEASGCELGAIYHSHTRSAPYPSQTDVNIAVPPDLGAPLWPGTVYLIAGVAGTEPDLRGYRIEAEGITEVELDIG